MLMLQLDLGNTLTVKTYKQPGETFIASLVLWGATTRHRWRY